MQSTSSPSSRLHISSGLDFVLLSDDEVLVQFGTRSRPSELLRDADMTGVIARVVARLLQGPATYAELLAAAGSPRATDTVALVNQLLERGFLTPDDQHPVEQYLRYASGGSTGLSRCAVTLFGCGPIGSRIGESLIQHGVGSIRLIDDRPVDRLWYQFTRSGGDRDRESATTAAEVLTRELQYGNAKVQAIGGQERAGVVDDAIAECDLAILALEQVDLRLAHLVNRFALRRQKAWLHVVIDGDVGVVGPLFEPPYTACYNDFRALATASTPSAGMMNRYRRHIMERCASSFFPGLPAHADIVAGHATLAAVHRLLGRTSFACGRAMFIDFEQMQIDVEDVLRLPRCPVCKYATSVARPVVPALAGEQAS